MSHKHTNDLVHETSPYLLQHAHNPVNWKPWNTETLALAKKENKPIIISIGYAACHWCHVMEEESFEDEEVAAFMNEHFINIKVDREERPDVDQVYMNAVQLMTNSGGWPLNVVTLPDGRPFWGGTYFTKEQWLESLQQLATVFKENPSKVEEYASKLETGIKSLDTIVINKEKAVFTKDEVNASLEEWSKSFDSIYGGTNRAPKFMMPNNYLFLLRYAFQTKNDKLLQHVNTTLTKMAYGGIYDQVGGGFARYSVDEKWHIPHFEKMLYDNAQLVSLYANAYAVTKNELYKNIVVETLLFVERELMTNDGIFYSSLDADSKNKQGALEEGAFYVWTEQELQTLLKDDFNLFKEYYNINSFGKWENENYVLIRTKNHQDIADHFNLSNEELSKKLSSWKKTLLTARDNRDRPRLDDKSLTSWNAHMLKGYIDAYKVLGNSNYLAIALKNAAFIKKKQLRNDFGLYHSYKNGKSTINGYLEDYAAVIDAFIALYEVTLDEQWLSTAKDVTNYTFDYFFDDNSQMFFFTSSQDEALVSRSIEKTDNVIPASNSIMAKNLYKLSHYFGNKKYNEVATQMLNNMKQDVANYPSSHGNWLDLMLNYVGKYYEVAIVGENALQLTTELNKYYLPNKMIIGSTKESNLPLLENRFIEDQTLFYVCVNSACKLPTPKIEVALQQINIEL
jgi:hypothetical protein